MEHNLCFWHWAGQQSRICLWKPMLFINFDWKFLSINKIAIWCSGYHYCTTSFKKAWTQVLCRFRFCWSFVGDSRWWESLTMVAAGNKAKRLIGQPDHKTIHHRHHHRHHYHHHSYVSESFFSKYNSTWIAAKYDMFQTNLRLMCFTYNARHIKVFFPASFGLSREMRFTLIYVSDQKKDHLMKL